MDITTFSLTSGAHTTAGAMGSNRSRGLTTWPPHFKHCWHHIQLLSQNRMATTQRHWHG